MEIVILIKSDLKVAVDLGIQSDLEWINVHNDQMNKLESLLHLTGKPLKVGNYTDLNGVKFENVLILG